jgi:hypothetical protein
LPLPLGLGRAEGRFLRQPPGWRAQARHLRVGVDEAYACELFGDERRHVRLGKSRSRVIARFFKIGLWSK